MDIDYKCVTVGFETIEIYFPHRKVWRQEPRSAVAALISKFVRDPAFSQLSFLLSQSYGPKILTQEGGPTIRNTLQVAREQGKEG